MSKFCGCAALPLLLLVSCAPGRSGAGGIGCSKTSSVLKAPQIRTINEMGDPNSPAPNEATHRRRVIKLFGAENTAVTAAPNFLKASVGGLNTSGGYLYITSRKKGDPLGLQRSQNGKIEGTVTRCGVLVEYPKNTGEVLPPGETGSNVFPSSNAEAFRFPTESDPLKLRLYTAAHCLDYSLNESITLRLFKGHREISSPSVDYLDLPIHVPEFEAIKTLRKEVKRKISEGAISSEQGAQILNAFRPANINLAESFGKTGAQGKCAEKPSSISEDTEQYSCATYHDMAVLDVTLPEGLPKDAIATVKSLRSAWVNNIKVEEAKGPWSEYVNENSQIKLFVDALLQAEINDTGSEAKCRKFTAADPSLPETRLGLFHPAPEKCLEIAIDSPHKLSFVRYISRERMLNFSRHNMIAQIKTLGADTLGMQNCKGAEGICTLTESLNAALKVLLPQASLNWIDTHFAKSFETSSRYVDEALKSWNPFLNSLADVASNNNSVLQQIINPVDFLKLHSNFVIKEDTPGDASLPDANDNSSARAFMTAPMQNIIGLDSYFESNAIKSDISANLPIEILSWSGTGPQGAGIGKFLKLFVTKGKLDAFFESISNEFNSSAMDPNMNPPPGVIQPPANVIVIADESTSYPNSPLPTKVYLQKGDSGSIFTLDSVPMFALSMVNGEPTSGGAQLAARSQEFEDTDDVMPVGPGDDGDGNDPSVVANTCK